MPLYDFQCFACQRIEERIVPSNQWEVQSTCCGQSAHRQLSAPGGIRANGAHGGMILSEAQMKKIKEPVLQDTKTGAIESAF